MNCFGQSCEIGLEIKTQKFKKPELRIFTSQIILSCRIYNIIEFKNTRQKKYIRLKVTRKEGYVKKYFKMFFV